MARPWGGYELCTRFGKPRPENDMPLGETWEASDLKGAISRVAEGPNGRVFFFLLRSV